MPVLAPGFGAAASRAGSISELLAHLLSSHFPAGPQLGEAVAAVVARAEQTLPEDRQFGVVVLGGGGAGWTGADTFDVALDRRGTEW